MSTLQSHIDNSSFPAVHESTALWTRARELIPAGTQTLAKGPAMHSDGIYPKYLKRGQGAHVWDVDDNQYLDLDMGIGPLILGYTHAVVDTAIKRQLEDGITFSLMHPLEVEVAELLREVIPNADSVRFSKTGADVTSAAVRLARAYTGREAIICCGYHGWHDWFIGTTEHYRGVPDAARALSNRVAYGDWRTLLESINDRTACVILEPLSFDTLEPGVIAQLRRQCDKHGALLVFDEMWTGFRCALGGAQEYLRVDADLALFSKAIANGMPLAAITGRHEVMRLLDKEVFFFTTFGGETLSLAAAHACIGFMRENPVVEYIAHLGSLLRDALGTAITNLDLERYIKVKGHAFRTMLAFNYPGDDPLILKTFVQQELLRARILWTGTHNLSYSHTEDDVEYIVSVFVDLLARLATAITAGNVERMLIGKRLGVPFRDTVCKPLALRQCHA